MIGVGRVLKIILMARETILRRARETIVDMAARTIHRIVRAEQWKRGAVVIEALPRETSGLPAGDHAAVALLAANRKPCLLVIGIRRGFKIFYMTRAALQR
mgnify:FL=1